MPIYLDTRGNSVLSVAVCDRCNRKFAYTDLQPDPNFPGMRVCKDDLDQFDPWRLPARQTENIALRHPRPDVSIGRTNSQLLTQGNLNNYAPGNSIFIDGIPPYAGAQGDLSTNGNGFNTSGNLPVPTPPNAPVVLSILPTSGSESGGTPVTITGSGFSGTTVQFGSTYADFTVINDSTIEAISPAGIFGQTVSITVTTNAGRGVGPNLFTYTAGAPVIYGVSPNTGGTPGGEPITITGYRFTGATSVTIGGTEVSSFTVVDDSHIDAVTPAHIEGAVNITVTTPNGTGIGNNLFTYTAPPPAIYITPGTTSWMVPADWSSTNMIELWGGGGGGGNGGSISDLGGSGGGGGGYARIVNTTSLTPGQVVTVAVGTGGAYSPNGITRGGTGGTTTFGSVYATGGVGGTNDGPGSVPGGSGVGGDVNYTGGIGGGRTFGVETAPGGNGDGDSIGGAGGGGMGFSQPNYPDVTGGDGASGFGGAGGARGVSESQPNGFPGQDNPKGGGGGGGLFYTTGTAGAGGYPAGGGAGTFGGVSADGADGVIKITYGSVPVPAPTVTSISPNTGYAAGGESVTITGTNFIGATSVTIGDVEVTSFTVVDAQNITTTTPAHAIGSASVTVTTASGTGTGTNLFTYTETPAYVFSVEALVVAGGGGGNRSYVPLSGPVAGGGGGGGGVIQATISLEATDYPVVVGAGGTGQYQSGQQYNSNATNGSNSSFASLVAIGGGKGGGSDYIVGNGGSGGGGGLSIGFPAPPRPPGGLGTPGQGYDGAPGGGQYTSPLNQPGGGGGAGAAATDAGGGIGFLSSITGTPTYYGGGGGASPPYGDFYPSGDGGLGGGGKGAYRDPSTLTGYNGENGTPNTGGGGGGGRYPSQSINYSGGNGGSGIVILRYLTAAALGYEITGGTVTTDGEYTIRTFTSSETMTITPPVYSQFTSNGTYTVPEGVTQVVVLGVGHGATGSTNPFSSNRGGGYGGQVLELTQPVTPGETLNIIFQSPEYNGTVVSSTSWRVTALDGGAAASGGSDHGAGGAGNNGANPGSSGGFGINGGAGGIGVLSEITGQYYGGGGGGAAGGNGIPGAGGLGGGGTGCTDYVQATPGAANSGGGGGGGRSNTLYPSAPGGSGFVAILPLFAPTINGITPNDGGITGGDTVTITGQNFTKTSQVTFAGTPVTFTVLSSTTIEAVTPAHAVGAVTVTVTNPAGTTTATAAFTYYDIAIPFTALLIGGGGGGGVGNGAGGAGGTAGSMQEISNTLTRKTSIIGIGQGALGATTVNSGGMSGGNSYIQFTGESIVANGGGGGGPSSGGWGGSGGTGAGGTGGIPNFPNQFDGGFGGPGLESNFTGTPTYYAGGGAGGSVSSNQAALGGVGGGGNGAYYPQAPATNGTNGLGSGGGGGSAQSPIAPAGRGGSGLVIIKYLTADMAGYTATGGVKTTNGAYTLHTFTSGGTLTIS